jgi:Tol biopolymer transport system component
MKILFTTAILIMATLFSFADDSCNNFWAVVSPDGNYIYFSSTMNGSNYEIYRTDIDGTSNLMRLTYSEESNFYPAVSPDGAKVVFQRGGYGANAEIFIMNNDGSGLVRLTENTRHDGFPNFSPDGETIIFEAWDDSNYPEIFTMNTDGTNRVQLTNEPGATWQSAPQYSPDGTKIYYSAGFNADNHYVMMDLDGSNRINITEPNDFGDSDWGLHFNPDGTKIIFFTTQWKGYNNGCDLVIADTDGSDWNKITEAANGEYFYGGMIHPTNGKIYYSYYPGTSGTYAIYKMNMDASEKEKISECVAFGFDEDEERGVLVYPNPANDILYINSSTDSYIQVCAPDGKCVLEAYGKSIEVGILRAGLYFVTVKPKGAHVPIITKFLKN